ncbi:serine hydrolase domain-containing protein [Sphingomonas sp. PB4P5]|uniref:serine hydrolase domain-containing protein n=1 Tax=Parasphingomonas puruogangriensis TaxID=3096155 RepID=UPI002FC8C647
MRIAKRLAMMAVMIGSIASAQGPSLRSAPTASTPAVSSSTAPAPAGQHPLTAADVDAWLDGYMPYALHSGDIAGAVVTVVKDGQVIAARGYGYADIAKRRPVDPARTLFRPGSVSKLVTWTAVMQQVEAGKIDLDVDVNRYIDFKIPARGGKSITMRQIMTHTTGFEEASKDIIFYDANHNISLEAYLKRWTPTRIFDAGTTAAYSNWATALAGYIVQRTSGMPFDDYVERRIFAPLGMRTATFRQPLPANLRSDMATGYPQASAPAKGFEIVGPAPAGSLSASGIDMARFMIAHLDNGRGILRPETAAMMHNSPFARVDPKSLIPPLNRMELGFFETNYNGREIIAHLGDTNEFHTSLHLFQKERVGFYVSFNSRGRDGAVGVLRTQLFQDFTSRYYPNIAPRDGRIDPAVAAEHARMMVGHWEVSRRSVSNFVNVLNLVGQVEVGLDDKGGLSIASLKGPGGAVKHWDEIAPFVWRERGGTDRVAAQVVDGKPVRWSFDLVAPFMAFDRVPGWRSAGWLMPALYASLAVLLLTLLYWPVAWFVRRRFAAPIAVSGTALKAYRATRIMAGLVLLVLGGWVLAFTFLFADRLSPGGLSALLWLLQIGGAIVFAGAVGIAAWNVRETWRDGRRWTRRVWSALVLLATLVVLLVAWAYSLIAMTGNY